MKDQLLIKEQLPVTTAVGLSGWFELSLSENTAWSGLVPGGKSMMMSELVLKKEIYICRAFHWLRHTTTINKVVFLAIN